jgi:hypothetical protein
VRAARLHRRDRWLAAATLTGFGLVALAARARPAPAGPGETPGRPSARLTPSVTAHPQGDRSHNVRPPAPEHFRLPWSLIQAILGATLLLAVIGLIVTLWPRLPALRWHRRPPPELRADEPALDDLARRVSHTLRTTEAQVAQGQVRDGIILCWHRLEQTAEAAGLSRRPADTSTDLATRLLTALPLSPAPMNRLAAVYREARFSTHPLGAEAVAQARADLAQLRSELDTSPAAANAAAGPVTPLRAHHG